MKAHSATSATAIILATWVAGCAQDGTLMTNGFNTSSISPEATTAQMPKSDPACVTLASEIDALNQEGVSDKIAKAAAKKYRMKSADLAKVDALNKAHAEFQTKCSSYPPSPIMAKAEPAATAPKVATKKMPPVPSPKPVASAMAPQTPTALAQPAAQP